MASEQLRQNLPSGFRDSRWDWLIGVAAMVSATLLFHLANNSRLWDRLSGARLEFSIGELKKQSGWVKFRQEGSQVWFELSSERQPVQGGDAVFTGDDGKALLELHDGSGHEIMPNSLLIIRPRDVQYADGFKGWLKTFASTPIQVPSVLQIQEGGVKLKLSKDQGPLDLLIRGKKVTVLAGSDVAYVEVGASRDEFWVKTDSSSRIKLQEGFLDKKDLRTINPNEIVEYHGTETFSSSFYINPTSPEDGATIVMPGKNVRSIPVAFSWEVKGDMKVIGDIFLEIEKGGKRDLHQYAAKQGTIHVPMMEGAHNWRIHPGGRWRSLTLIPLAPPEIWGPSDKFYLATPEDQKRMVNLTWKPLPLGFSSEVELVRQGEEREVTYEKGSAAGVRVALVGGEYQWRVRSLDPEGHTSDWGPYQDLHLTGKPPEPTPVPEPVVQPMVVQAPSKLVARPKPVVLPAARKVMTPVMAPHAPKQEILLTAEVVEPGRGQSSAKTKKELSQIQIKLQWSALPNVNSYRVVILTDEGEKIREVLVGQARYDLAVQSVDELLNKYRIEATMPSGEKIESNPIAVSYGLSSPMQMQLNEARRKRKRTVIVAWEYAPLADSYQIQIAQDQEFRHRVVDKTEARNHYIFVPKEKGTYYWRMRSLTKGKASQWGALKALEVK